MGIILGRKAGQAGRPAGAEFSSRTPQFLSKTDRFSTETAKFLLGAATLFVRNTALSSVGSTQEPPLLCSRHSTPLVGPEHSLLFATQHSSGRTTTLSSVRDIAFLWWDHSILLCSQQSIPLMVPQHSVCSRQHIPLVPPQHSPLIATAGCSAGATALLSLATSLNNNMKMWFTLILLLS